MRDKVFNAVSQMNKLSIKEFIQTNNLYVYSTSDLSDNEDGCLIKDKIWVRKYLPRNYRKFIILHEIGHYIMHKNDALAFSYSQLGHRNKLEVEANAFACMKLLENEDLEEVNVIDLLIRKGVPKDIAIKFYEWMN